MLDPRLNHVVAVAHGGSFTRAAQIVGVTQSAITKSVADLERELGFSIFYRTSRGVLLTEEGRDFVERAARLLEDARALLKGVGDRSDPYAGVLRIGVGPSTLEWLLARPLALLLSRYPTIRFEVIGAPFERVIQLLRSGSIDVALGLEDAFAEWSDVRLHPIAMLRTVLFVRRGHPILARGDVTIADLAAYDFVSPSDSRPYGRVIRDIYEGQGLVGWERRLHVIDNVQLGRRIVAMSDAIGVAAVEYAETRDFGARFREVPETGLLAPSPMCCAVRSRWDPKPAARAFLRAMAETLPRQP